MVSPVPGYPSHNAYIVGWSGYAIWVTRDGYVVQVVGTVVGG